MTSSKSFVKQAARYFKGKQAFQTSFYCPFHDKICNDAEEYFTLKYSNICLS